MDESDKGDSFVEKETDGIESEKVNNVNNPEEEANGVPSENQEDTEEKEMEEEEEQEAAEAMEEDENEDAQEMQGDTEVLGTLTDEQIDALKVTELKDELKKRGIKATGKKQVLIDALKEGMKS